MDLFKKCQATMREVGRAFQLGIYPYFTPIESGQDRRVQIDGHEFIMIGSNGYLGLASDHRLKDAAVNAIKKYGTTCSGSRFLNGTLDIHVKLENDLAHFFQKDLAIVFSTGFQSCLGIISAITNKDDFILLDRQNHASIMDGSRLSFAQVKKYKHNDVEDLDRLLSGLPANKPKLIVVDGVFSMEGDMADLTEIVRIKKKYGARLMVDDAHGIGVLGKNGRGTCEHFGVLDDVDLLMGTFSKSFAALGGFVVGPEDAVTHIKHTARSFIFSASMTPASVASAQAALEIIKTEPERRERLWKITKRILAGFRDMGFDTGNSTTPVIPVIIGENERCFAFWKSLYENRIFANPVISPATPPGRALIRTTYMATHTKEDIDIVLEVFQKCGRAFGLIK
jgi:8-amino-7-oxononanoate synthase